MTEIIPHWLQKQADLNPGRLALETPEGTTITFGDLHKAVDIRARKLASLGVQQDPRVAVLSHNSVEYGGAYPCAKLYWSNTVLLLYTRLTASEWLFQLQDSEADLLLTAERFEKTGAGY